MNKNIFNDFTNLEAEDNVIVFSTFERILKRAKTAADKAAVAERMVYKALDVMGIDPSYVPTDAENADNLGEAISCFLNYNEYSVAGIMKEVREVYGMEDQP